ncbi:hypothetical protein [Novosphingobium terrae]|uniref:hypothetical protein n=1 Tax=Novosphingobium terrae TaxID=2726189 RepID=UPI00197F04D5|nr:hypothetical protein [Novosphingobium terrae]
MAHTLRTRLREGRATPGDQLLLRGTGLLAYGAFAAFLWTLCWLQQDRPRIAAHPAMFAACFVAVVVFHIGSALTWGGPELFRGER